MSRDTSSVAQPFTKAGAEYLSALTAWLQDTRLMSEAIFRLSNDYQQDGKIDFSDASWQKPKKDGGPPLKQFEIKPAPLDQRMDLLLKNLWGTRFVFLETLWEEYLQELVKELRRHDATILEPFCEKELVADVVREVLSDRFSTLGDVKDEVAARIASSITRLPWDQQWKHLRRLQVGLNEKDQQLSWFANLTVYFEMRNCIVHLQGQVSPTLRKTNPYYDKRGIDRVEPWPAHLDFYRHQFIACLMHIEAKVRGKFGRERPRA